MRGELNPFTTGIKLRVALLALIAFHVLAAAVAQAGSTPQEFGARGDGFTDDTAAFQAALNAGDVSVPSAKYLIRGPVWVPDFRTIRCDSGATLLNPIHARDGNAIFQWNGTGHGMLTGCTLEGTNDTSPPGFDADREFNFLVLIASTLHGTNGDVTIAGNVFRNTWANAAVSVYGNDTTGPVRKVVIRDNEFRNCGLYGAVLVSSVGSYVGYNRAFDCSMGQEPDNLRQVLTDNVFEHNLLKKIHGTGYKNIPMFLTGGQVLTFDFSKNRLSRNICDGADIRMKTAGPSAIYVGNTCINGCSVFADR